MLRDLHKLRMGAMRAAGFTLIELVITVAIVGVLATLVLPLAQITAQRSKEQDLRAALREIRSAIDAYKDAADRGGIAKPAEGSGYPPTLEALVEGADDLKRPQNAKIYFLRRIPRDPFAPDPQTEAKDTWGLRSYESPPDSPQPGGDVYDVYSMSTQTGLNGIPYNEW